MKCRDEDTWESCEALRVANDIINIVNLDDVNTFSLGSKLADEYFNSCRGKNSGFQLYALGHCHIDTAWLWPYAETKRKCARSWSTQLRLIERYPNYKFVCSQAQQYSWVKKNYPQLFKEIQLAVEKGNFIPVGGTWVEMDCNIPSGESLVRQFLYGQRFFKKYFNVETSPIFWLPDTFGYAAQLPQIIRKAGMKYFLTQKLSWNQINKFPHNTFIWEGIDGSNVITHFPPADNYCSHATPADIYKSEHNFKDKEGSSSALLVYGHGDGGGGPNPKMLEYLTRISNSSFGGLPSIEFKSPVDFFNELEKSSSRFCKWNGELYFEYHRGTYTTQAKNKLFNRRCEDLMREFELLSFISQFLTSNNQLYNKKQIRKLWKLILLNQFHDVIPGTSIPCVYEDSTTHYTFIFNELKSNKENLLKLILENNLNSSSIDNNKKQFFIFNSLGFQRNEIIEIPFSEDILNDKNLLVQPINNNQSILAVASIPPCGFTIQNYTNLIQSNNNVTHPVQIEEKENLFILTNKWIKVEINNLGQIISMIWLNTGRQIIKKESVGNCFKLFDDHPLYWDAWDVDVYHLEKTYEIYSNGKNSNIHGKIIENGPLRVAIEFSIQISEKSSLKQIIRLSSENSLLEFDTNVSWFESHKFLKVQFPLHLKSQQCTYEIPYGWVQRPTHFNTSWDIAKFEVCAHRWSDLSEYNFGVSLLNDCKYGYSTLDSTMTLSLLRSPKAPDDSADMGEHSFRYAILPHENSYQDARVVQYGLQFNNPLQVRSVNDITVNDINYSLIQIKDQHSIFIDQIKMSEDSSAMIARFYEAYGGAVFNCEITLGQIAKEIHFVNLLENEIDNSLIASNTSTFSLNFEPFEIVTIKVIF